MIDAAPYMTVLLAGSLYYVLGGLWFSPLVGGQWDLAVGFKRPHKWRPDLRYYIVPMLGSLAVAGALQLVRAKIHPASVFDAMGVGAIVGISVAAPITGINAVSPNVPRPALYAAVTGTYHALGAILCGAVLFGLRGAA